jgi:hypothetical protein
MSAKTFVKYFAVLLFVNLAFAASAYSQNALAAVNERFVMGDLEKIGAAQATYYSTTGNGNFGSFFQLQSAGLIDAVLAAGSKHRYGFSLFVVQRGPGQSPMFRVSALPQRYGKSGKRSFYFDQTWVIRGADKNGEEANVLDPALQPFCGEGNLPAVMRGLNSAEATFFSTVGANFSFGTSSQLAGNFLIDPYLGGGEKCGYRFTVVIFAAAAGIPPSYWVKAVPAAYGLSGFRSYYTDQTGIIRGADHGGTPAAANDPPLEN